MPDRLDSWRSRNQAMLARVLDAQAGIGSARLLGAMRHAALGGGKRLRALLVYATGHALGADEASLDAPAAAVELVHAYSLVHDDLPAMDDDVLRRGKPTVHVAYDEATAILAGDALQSLAFAVLADAPLPSDLRVGLVRELAVALGARGMCGGQALDIEATGQAASIALDALETLHALKTGALLRAAVRMGAIAAAADAAAMPRLDDYAGALGLAFQIRDDLLDVEGDSTTLGKTAGKDAASAKATFASLIGVAASRERLQDLHAAMQDALAAHDQRADALRTLATLVVQRRH